MIKRRYWLVAALLALTLAGCDDNRPPVVRAKAEPNTTYDFNGEIEGCRLYRVRPRYGSEYQLAICSDQTTRATWRYSCGKNCTRDAVTLTVVKS